MTGQRSKRSGARTAAEYLVAFVVSAGVLLVLVAYCTGHDSASNAPPTAQASRALPTLSAEVRQVGPLLSVANRDPFPWSSCILSLNLHGFSGNGFDQEVPRIEAGKQVVLDLTEFASSDGLRFNPISMKVLTVYIACSTPRGRASFAGASQMRPPD